MSRFMKLHKLLLVGAAAAVMSYAATRSPTFSDGSQGSHWTGDSKYAFDFTIQRAAWDKITKTPGNLVTAPEDFGNAAWTKSRSSISANAIVAPDGTLTADKLIEDATAAATHRIYQLVNKPSSAPIQYTFSVYLKAAERAFATVRIMDNTEADGCTISVDLTTGAIGSGPGGTGANPFTNTSATTTTLANGWFLFTLSGITDSDSQVSAWVYLSSALGVNTYTGDGTSGIYVWGARLDAGTPQPYFISERVETHISQVPGYTFTRASGGYALDSAGNLVWFESGAPRITDRGYLSEAARTNMCLQSQTLDHSTWAKTRSSITADAAVAPDGTTTADKLVEDGTAGNTHAASQGITIATATTYTGSGYFKAAERTAIRVAIGDTGGNNSVFAYFNLVDGTVHSTGSIGTGWTLVGTAIEALANGWYRCSVTGTSAAATNGILIFYISNPVGTFVYAGDSASGIYVWGAQFEAASFPSSYIPTTTASVARAADSLTITGVTGLDYPVTACHEFDFPSLTTGSLTQIDAGDSTNRAVWSIETGNFYDLAVTSGGAGQGNSRVAAAITPNTIIKAAARVATNSIRAMQFSVLAAEDVSATVPARPTTINIGRNHSGVAQPFAYIRRIAIFARALTDAELQAIPL